MDMLSSVSATRMDNLSWLPPVSVTRAVDEVEAERSLPAINQQNASFQVNVSGSGLVLGDLAALENSATTLTSPFTFGLKATSSNPGVASASLYPTAASGFYALQVSQLAQPEVLLSAGLASRTAAIGSGAPTTLTFQFGTTSGGVFTPNPNQAGGSVTIGATNNSLQGIAAAINGAGIGVNAFIVQDNGGFHLEVASATTGAASGLKIGVSGDSALTNLLAYNPVGNKALTEIVTPQNALFSVNGVAGSSASNTVSEVLPGITLNLNGVGQATLFVNNNPATAFNAITSFVNAFNTLNNALNRLNGLYGNPLLGGLLDQLRGIANGTAGLGGIGITINNFGTLGVNSLILQNAISTNPAGVGTVFGGNGLGLANSVVSLAQTFLNPTGSLFGLSAFLQNLQAAQQALALETTNFALANLLHSSRRAQDFLRQLLQPYSGHALGNLLAAATQASLINSLVLTP